MDKLQQVIDFPASDSVLVLALLINLFNPQLRSFSLEYSHSTAFIPTSWDWRPPTRTPVSSYTSWHKQSRNKVMFIPISALCACRGPTQTLILVALPGWSGSAFWAGSWCLTEHSVTAEGMQRVLFELLTTQTQGNRLSLPFLSAMLHWPRGQELSQRRRFWLCWLKIQEIFHFHGMFPYTRVKLWTGDFTQSSSVRLRRAAPPRRAPSSLWIKAKLKIRYRDVYVES